MAVQGIQKRCHVDIFNGTDLTTCGNLIDPRDLVDVGSKDSMVTFFMSSTTCDGCRRVIQERLTSLAPRAEISPAP